MSGWEELGRLIGLILWSNPVMIIIFALTFGISYAIGGLINKAHSNISPIMIMLAGGIGGGVIFGILYYVLFQ